MLRWAMCCAEAAMSSGEWGRMGAGGGGTCRQSRAMSQLNVRPALRGAAQRKGCYISSERKTL